MCSIFKKLTLIGLLVSASLPGIGFAESARQLNINDSRDPRLTRYETLDLSVMQSATDNPRVSRPVHVVRPKVSESDSGIYVWVYNSAVYSDDPAIFSYKNFSTNQTIDDDPIHLTICDVSVCTEPGSDQRWLVAGGFRHDSAFVVKTLPGSEKFEWKYLCSGQDHSGNGVWEPSVQIVASNDYDYDGREEVFVEVHPGRDLRPRILFCLQLDSLKEEWELPVATGVRREELYSAGDSLHPAVLFSSYNMKQGVSDDNFSDFYAYLTKVDAAGKVLFNYIGSVEHGTVQFARGESDSVFYVACSQPLLSSTDTVGLPESKYRLYKINRDGAKLDSVLTGSIVNSLFMDDYSNNGRKELITVNTVGVVTIYDPDLHKQAESRPTTLRTFIGTMQLPGGRTPSLLFGCTDGTEQLYSFDFSKRATFTESYSYFEPIAYDADRQPTAYIGGRGGGGVVTQFHRRDWYSHLQVVFNDYQTYILLALFGLLLGLLAVNYFRLKKSHALTESELRLSALLDETPVGVAMYQDGRLRYANRTLSQTLGFSPEELTDAKFSLAVIHQEDLPKIRADMERLLAGQKQSSRYESRMYTRNGELHHFEVHNTRILNMGRPAVIGVFMDITERQNARAQLERETHTLNNIIDLNPYPIGIFDRSGHFLRANESFYALFRSAPDADYNFFDDPIAQRLGHADRVKDTLLSGKQYTAVEFAYNAHEVDPKYPDNPLLLNVVMFPIADTSGEIEYFVFMYEDISARQRAERALRESEERFRALAECSLVGIYIFQDRRFTYVNPKMAELVEMSVEQALAMTDPLEFVHPDDRAKVEEFIRQRLSGETDFVHYEFRIVVPEKLDKYVEVFGSSMQFHGKPAVIGTMLDVTERRQAELALQRSEEKYRTLLENIPIGVFRSIPGGQGFYSVNPSMSRMYGYSEEEMLTRAASQLYCDVKDGRELKRLLDTSDAVTGFESRMKRKDGSSFWISSSIRAIRDESGKLLYYDGIDIDITNQKQAEQSLRESEEKYRAVLEQSSECIYLIDPESMSILQANPAMQRLLGYSAEEFRTLRADQIAAEGTPIIRAKIEAARTQGSVFMADRRYRRKDGSLVDVEVSANLITYGGSEVLCVVSRDVTERLRSERMLRQREEMLAAQYHAIPVPTYTWQRKGDDFILIDFNQKAREITEGQIANYRGVALSELFRTDPEMIANIHQAFERQTSLQWEMLYNFKSTSKQRYLAVNLSYVPNDLVLVHTTDITDRKEAEKALVESEAKFRSLAESTSAAILMFQDDKMIYANPMAVTITGYTREEILAFDFWEIIHPDVRDRVRERGLARQRGEPVVKSYEVPLLTKDRRKKWMLYTGDVIDFNGRPAVLGTAFDITDRKQAEAELLVANQERYNQVKEIAGGIAHEIYNALFPATSMLDKLRKKLGNGEGNGDSRKFTSDDESDIAHNLRLIGMAEASLERAIKMTETVTQFSRIESQREIEEIELEAFFEDLVQAKPKMHKAITYRLDVRASLKVRMNRGHTFSLFSNILNNALDALEERGAGHIDIVISRSGTYAAVDIIDNGPGIPEEALPKVFNPFFSTKPRTGTGLGLAICKKVTDLYGGKIAVESTIDKGTRFSILLPAS